MEGSSTKPPRVSKTMCDLDAGEIYAMPSKTLEDLQQPSQHPNVARILREMQAFRYVDSESKWPELPTVISKSHAWQVVERISLLNIVSELKFKKLSSTATLIMKYSS